MLQEVTDALRRGDTAAALAAANDALRTDPDNAALHHVRGLALRAHGDRDDAAAALDRAIALAPEHAPYRISRAGVLLDGKDIDGARRELDAALALDPNQLAAYVMGAHLALMTGERDAAARQLKLAQRINAEHPHVLGIAGQLAQLDGDADGALRLFVQAAQLVPDDPAVLSTLALAYLARGNLAFAEQTLRQAIALQPAAPHLREALVASLQRQERVDEALAEAQALLARQPDDVSTLAACARLAHRLGQHDAAVDYLQTAVQRDPHDAAMIGALEDLWRQRGDETRATEFLEAQLQRTPDADNLWLVRLSLRALVPQAGIAVAERWVAACPHSALANETLARYCEAAGDGARAQTYAETALALNPARLVARTILYRAELHDDPDAAAARVMPLINADDPEIGLRARRLLGHAHDRAGRRAQAVEAWLAAHAAQVNAGPWPTVGAVPATLSPLGERSADAPILLWGAPGSGVDRIAALLQTGGRPPVLADRWSGTPRLDGFSAPQQWLDGAAGADARTDFAAAWREGVAGRGAPPPVIDWIVFWDARLAGPVREQLAGTRLLVVLRDPRDMFLHWLAFGAPGNFRLDDLARAADALAAALEHALWVLDHDALPTQLLRYEDLLADPVAGCAALAAAARSEATLDPAIVSQLARDAGGHPTLFAPGRWREFAAELQPALARLTPISQRLGYGD